MEGLPSASVRRGFRGLAAAVLFLVSWPVACLRAELLVSRGTTWRYVKGSAEASDPRSEWRMLDYADAAWPKGLAPFGFGESGLGTTLSDMQGSYSTFFIRKTFTVSGVDAETRLRALVDYDDGFILWINGERVFEKNEPDGEPLHDSQAAEEHESGAFEAFDDPNPDDYLEPGQNVVAVQAFNSSRSSGDCKLDVELSTFKRVADTTFSHDRGFYDAPFTVTISTATAGATIRYTTDGAAPTASSGIVGGTNAATVAISEATCLRAAAFKSGYEPTDVDTQTYIFAAAVRYQPENPPGFPAYWGTNTAHTANYNVSSSILTDTEVLKLLPTLSLVAKRGELFGTYGIYGDTSPRARETAVSLELIYPPDFPLAHAGGFQIDAGVRRHSTWGNVSKRALKLFFRGEYGATKLRYPFFEAAIQHADSATDTFDKLVLRSSNDERWKGTVLVRDQWARDSQIAISGAGVHGTFMHLYINGLYWGVYNPLESADHAFAASYFGGDKDDWFAVDHDWKSGACINGDPARWKYLHSTLRKRDMSAAANYEEAMAYLDMALYCDELIVRWYCGVGDWPGNNWHAVQRMNPPGPASYYCWDCEFSWYQSGDWRNLAYPNLGCCDGAWVHPAFYASDHPFYGDDNPALFRALKANANFLTLFADRVYKHCANGGGLTEADSKERWTTLCHAFEDPMYAERARWGWGSYGAAWATARDSVLNMMTANDSQMMDVCRARGYYPSLAPPSFNRHGGAIVTGFRLTMSNPNTGTSIYYTLDGSDPRRPGGSPLPAASCYTGPVPLSKTTHVKARAYKSVSTWSAVHEATYNFTAHYSKLRITEIMYNPLGGSDFEFVELKNTGASARGLSEMTFKGLRYTFPPGAELEAGQTLLLVNNAAAFTNRY
ncbi:MAG: chitobiase/beta-hexosaminidase C-terminal domain-containing protein, partial [Kiritimatiellae bacterium]|nr:chitobiase/beta-hexosaminidase C-terminal domain-containing protein [Kiritimatiellia bacterium]